MKHQSKLTLSDTHTQTYTFAIYSQLAVNHIHFLVVEWRHINGNALTHDNTGHHIKRLDVQGHGINAFGTQATMTGPLGGGGGDYTGLFKGMLKKQ